MKLLKKMNEKITALAVSFKCSGSKNTQKSLLLLGVVFLSLGITDLANAASSVPAYNPTNADAFKAIITLIFCFLEGAFGALIMVIAGIGAIVSASFGNYKASLTLLIVAVGSFVLKGIVGTFFPEMVEADACAGGA